MQRSVQMTLPDATWKKLRTSMPKPADHKDCEWLSQKPAIQKYIRNNSGTRCPSPPDPATEHTLVRILRRHKNETRFAPAWVWRQHHPTDGAPPPGASTAWEWKRTGSGYWDGEWRTTHWYVVRYEVPVSIAQVLVYGGENFTCKQFYLWYLGLRVDPNSITRTRPTTGPPTE